MPTSRNPSKRIHQHRLWSITALLLFVDIQSVSSVIASSSRDNSSHNSNANANNDASFISLKLTPRHVELERRRRERKLRVSDTDSEGDNGERQYRRREEAVQVGALFEGYGTHYVDLWCGSPPQRQTVIVDTGSGVTAFPCSECKDCGAPNYHIDDLFSEQDSSTFKTSTCSNRSDCIMSRSNCRGDKCLIGMSYAEGSKWDAKEVVDRCYVGGPHETPLIVPDDKASLEGDDMNPLHAADLAFDMTFGCQNVVTGLFKTQMADGIMGMSNQPSTYWSQMFEAGKMGSDKNFGLCFSRPPLITKAGTEAGAMTLGGVDERLHLTPLVYTSNFNSGRSTFFSVKVRKMMLREGKYGESAQSTDVNPHKGVTVLDIPESTLNTGGVIVDSGTTDTYWNGAIAQAFKVIFKEMAGWEHDNQKHRLSDKEFAKLPTILLQLYSDEATNGHIPDPFKAPGLAGAMDVDNKYDVILAIPPSHYMEYSPEGESYTSRFYPVERSGSVLGANAMMGHDVSFDVDNNRIGWAESKCDYTSTVQDSGYSFDIDGTLKNAEKVDSTSINAENKISAGDDAPAPCESISSGTSCQKVETCSWNYGKCKTNAAAAAAASNTNKNDGAEPPQSESGGEERLPPDEDGVPDGLSGGGGGDFAGFDSSTDTVADLLVKMKDNALQIGITVTIIAIVFCCYFCLFCRRTPSGSSDRKYSRTVSTNIEMTNGSNFQDEPIDEEEDNDYDDDDDDNYDDDDDDDAYHDDQKSRDGPEFEGDFA